MPRSRTVTRTFSLSKELVEALEKEALSREISTSSLMNQTIDRSVKLDWPSEKTGDLVIGREIIQGLINAVSDEELRKIGKTSAQNDVYVVRVFHGAEQNLGKFLKLLEVNYGRNARWFNFTYTINGRDNKILLNHVLGLKWSSFLESYMKSFFMEMFEIPVKSNTTDNVVVIEFRI